MSKKQYVRHKGLDRVEKYVATDSDMREVVLTYIKKTFNTAISMRGRRGVKSLWICSLNLFLSAVIMEKFSNPVLIHTAHQLATATHIMMGL